MSKILQVRVQLTLIKHLTWLVGVAIFCGLIYFLSQAKDWEQISFKCRMPKDTYFEFKAQKDQAVKKSE